MKRDKSESDMERSEMSSQRKDVGGSAQGGGKRGGIKGNCGIQGWEVSIWSRVTGVVVDCERTVCKTMINQNLSDVVISWYSSLTFALPSLYFSRSSKTGFQLVVERETAVECIYWRPELGSRT